mmetsp:Transcript_5246/g.6680  ORF Transcript_5246/g.6680 Transcript_5246/m.6680 type:complete len:261 (+) Transcript_5246:143-925(+)
MCRGPRHEWLGIEFDHAHSSYKMSDKFIAKIPVHIPEKKPFHYYESLIARLVYASRVMRIPMTAYYWAIKYMRRQVSKLNKGMLHDSTDLQPPSVALGQLNEWYQKVQPNHWRKYQKFIPDKAVLFTDASLDGWGAVLFLDNGAVYGTGASWNKEVEINQAEALAVENAFYAFKAHWNLMHCTTLYVDNTSVHASLRKQWSNSENVSTALSRLFELFHRENLLVAAYYVGTKEKYADPWSRDKFKTWRQGGVFRLNDTGE